MLQSDSSHILGLDKLCLWFKSCKYDKREQFINYEVDGSSRSSQRIINFAINILKEF